MPASPAKYSEATLYEQRQTAHCRTPSRICKRGETYVWYFYVHVFVKTYYATHVQRRTLVTRETYSSLGGNSCATSPSRISAATLCWKPSEVHDDGTASWPAASRACAAEALSSATSTPRGACHHAPHGGAREKRARGGGASVPIVSRNFLLAAQAAVMATRSWALAITSVVAILCRRGAQA